MNFSAKNAEIDLCQPPLLLGNFPLLPNLIFESVFLFLLAVLFIHQTEREEKNV